MSYISNMLKGGVNNAVNQIKSYDVAGTLKSGIDMAGIQTPKMPERMTQWKMPKIETGRIRLPAGVDTYIPSAFADKMPKVDVEGLTGLTLPSLPDLSSVTSELEGYLGGIGLNTDKLGIRSIGDILANPDLSELKKVEVAQYVDLDNLPDITHSMDGLDLSEMDSQFDTILNSVPSVSGFDLSKYF